MPEVQHETQADSLGHQSSSINGTWALNDVNAQKDFGYRAFQLSYQAAKTLTEQYYSKPISKKYYLGCSTAGRMGLVEAQRYPKDFDGIVSHNCSLTLSKSLFTLPSTCRSLDHLPILLLGLQHGISIKADKYCLSTEPDGSRLLRGPSFTRK